MPDAGLTDDVRRLRLSIEEDRRANAMQWQRVDQAFAQIADDEERHVERVESRGLRLAAVALVLHLLSVGAGGALVLTHGVSDERDHAGVLVIAGCAAMILGIFALVCVMSVFLSLQRMTHEAMRFSLRMSSRSRRRDDVDDNSLASRVSP